MKVESYYAYELRVCTQKHGCLNLSQSSIMRVHLSSLFLSAPDVLELGTKRMRSLAPRYGYWILATRYIIFHALLFLFGDRRHLQLQHTNQSPPVCFNTNTNNSIPLALRLAAKEEEDKESNHGASKCHRFSGRCVAFGGGSGE